MGEVKKSLNAHLAVVFNVETGLYHGAIYRNHPTPSGCDRFFLEKTTNEGWLSPRKAAEQVNIIGEELGIELLDADKFEDIPPVPDLSAFSSGDILTLVTPNDRGESAYVETEVDGKIVETGLHKAHLDHLLAQGKINMDSSSGRDPELSAIYDHYVFV